MAATEVGHQPCACRWIECGLHHTASWVLEHEVVTEVPAGQHLLELASFADLTKHFNPLVYSPVKYPTRVWMTRSFAPALLRDRSIFRKPSELTSSGTKSRLILRTQFVADLLVDLSQIVLFARLEHSASGLLRDVLQGLLAVRKRDSLWRSTWTVTRISASSHPGNRPDSARSTQLGSRSVTQLSSADGPT